VYDAEKKRFLPASETPHMEEEEEAEKVTPSRTGLVCLCHRWV